MTVAHCEYLVVGGGVAADAAVRGIREVDAKARVDVLSAEDAPPYDRPPLSKALWRDHRMEGLFHHLDYGDLGVTLHLTTPVARVRPDAHEVVDGTGRSWTYRKLLLATGATPRPLPAAVAGREHALAYRTLDDYLALRRAVDEGARRILVAGGGFIGAELAAALSQAADAMKVTLLFPEPKLWSARLPDAMAAYLTRYYEERGVEVASGDEPRALEKLDGQGVRVRAASGREWVVDLVVAGVGVAPTDALARDAGIRVADGVVVDAFGKTSAPDVYACGDVASFPLGAAGESVRVEHEDHAHRHGRLVGRNMAGRDEPYMHIPMFYSDLFDLGFEAVGRLDSRLATYEDWVEPLRQGVVYYLDGSRRVAGVLLWNVWDRVDAARELLREGRAWPRDEELAGRIRG